MRFLLALLMFIGLTASAALLYTRDLTVEGTGHEERSVTAVVFVPDDVVSLRLRDARGRERDLTILDKAGGRVELFFNALPGEILTLDHQYTGGIPEALEDGRACKIRLGKQRLPGAEPPGHSKGFLAYLPRHPAHQNSRQIHIPHRVDGCLLPAH